MAPPTNIGVVCDADSAHSTTAATTIAATSVIRPPIRSTSEPDTSWPSTQPAPNAANTKLTTVGPCPRSATK